MPAITLDKQHAGTIEKVADDPDDEDHRREMVVRQRFARILDGVAETRGDPKQFRRHEHDPRNAEREANTGQHVERDRRQDNLRQHVNGPGAEIARHLEPGGIDLGQPGGGGERHGPDGSDRNEENNRLVPGRVHNHREWHPGERADHAQQLEWRITQLAEPLAAAHEDADRYADGDGEEQPDTHAVAGGHNGLIDRAIRDKRGERLERRNRTEGDKRARVRIERKQQGSKLPDGEHNRKTDNPVKKTPRPRGLQAVECKYPGGRDGRAHTLISSTRL